jgi:hypothetical protein
MRHDRPITGVPAAGLLADEFSKARLARPDRLR